VLAGLHDRKCFAGRSMEERGGRVPPRKAQEGVLGRRNLLGTRLLERDVHAVDGQVESQPARL
jgi:hypothetical protein